MCSFKRLQAYVAVEGLRRRWLSEATGVCGYRRLEIYMAMGGYRRMWLEARRRQQQTQNKSRCRELVPPPLTGDIFVTRTLSPIENLHIPPSLWRRRIEGYVARGGYRRTGFEACCSQQLNHPQRTCFAEKSQMIRMILDVKKK
ncbi:hypothetical protein PoB_007544700 [Plakobranchus ocellatus]|uniref:Uncharacterized protein n=1 Tax=Plakobranchus ocellatus TaxID=259542 RepID=A0AAV4DXB7_9GAST|nr:hypothetical protein PoB_007544700 [Plakobranchus ocellatus]